MLRLEPRQSASLQMKYAAPLIAAAATIVAGTILFGALGHDPVEALYTFFIKPLTTTYGLGELGLKAIPLLLCAIGLSVGFRGNVWNIGAEGQLVVGAICGGSVALAFYGEEGPWLLPLMILAGALGGMAYGAIPAILKNRFNANEILTSLMLVYVSIEVLSYLVHGPLKDPEGYNFPQSRLFNPEALMPILLPGTRLHYGALLALLLTFAVWLFMSRSFQGYKVTVAGQAPAAAAYAGYSRKRVVLIGFLTSGGMAGLAGTMEVSGAVEQLIPNLSPGYGFAAIIVAFLGRLHPIGIIFAALLVSLMYLGGETLQIDMKLPKALANLFQGMLLFFVLGSEVLIRYRIRIGSVVREA